MKDDNLIEAKWKSEYEGLQKIKCMNQEQLQNYAFFLRRIIKNKWDNILLYFFFGIIMGMMMGVLLGAWANNSQNDHAAIMSLYNYTATCAKGALP